MTLSQGFEALVDDEDYDRVSAQKWSVALRGDRRYATSRLGLLHRFILGLSRADAVDVDHLDGNGLNNRRSNLRRATRSQNNANQRPQVGRSSRFKGVSWSPDKGIWRAQIKSGGRNIALGGFRSEEEAARAYDAAASELFGEFARPNGVTR